MISLYELTHEIKKATGWAQERIGAETGLGLSTISRIFRVPGYTVSEVSRSLIVQLHEQVVRSPFPRYLEKTFNRYDVHREKMSKKDFADLQESYEYFIVQHQALGTQSLEACRLCWLMGHIFYDRAFYMKHDAVRNAAKALEWYQKALDILEHFEAGALLVQKYKIRQCVVSTNFNSCDPGTRADNPKIREWLQGMGYLEIVEKVIEEDAWNWMAARNGLVAASVLHDYPKCRFFWRAMQDAHKNFYDLDFQPSKDVIAIAADPDLKWFVTQLLDEE